MISEKKKIGSSREACEEKTFTCHAKTNKDLRSHKQEKEKKLGELGISLTCQRSQESLASPTVFSPGTSCLLHCDMNAYFASVEAVLRPELKDLPVAVCGSQKARHGIVLAKSPAAKKAKVQTGETIQEAIGKCPDLIIVPPHYPAYTYFFQAAAEIYRRFTPNFQSYGLDEFWLDISNSHQLFGTAEETAWQVKETIKAELGLTISVGLSCNKILAKLANDLSSPDSVYVLGPDRYPEQIANLPIESLWGIGPATKRRLNRYGIYTLGVLRQCPPDFLQRKLGLPGPKIWGWLHNQEDSPVADHNALPAPKSLSRGFTSAKDLLTLQEVQAFLQDLAEGLARALREQGLQGKVLNLEVKDCELRRFSYRQRMPMPSNHAQDISQLAFQVFCDHHPFVLGIRAMRIMVQDLQKETYQDLGALFGHKKAKAKIIDQVADDLKKKYRKDILISASALFLPSTRPDNLGKMPIYPLGG